MSPPWKAPDGQVPNPKGHFGLVAFASSSCGCPWPGQTGPGAPWGSGGFPARGCLFKVPPTQPSCGSVVVFVPWLLWLRIPSSGSPSVGGRGGAAGLIVTPEREPQGVTSGFDTHCGKRTEAFSITQFSAVPSFWLPSIHFWCKKCRVLRGDGPSPGSGWK